MPVILLLWGALFAQPPQSLPVPQIVPRLIMPGEGITPLFWSLAPVVCIATIESAQQVGPDVPVADELSIHLVEVRAQMEVVLRGDVTPGPLRFYHFTNALVPNVGYTTPLSWFQPKHRYALFLRKDHGLLRTMADLAQPVIRIRSGVQDYAGGKHIPTSPAVGAMVAEIALTPSPDREAGFAAGLEDTYGHLLSVASRTEIALILKRLVASHDRQISDFACLVLTVHYEYRDPCSERLLASDNPIIRHQAKTSLPHKDAAEPWLIKALEEEPTSLSATGEVPDLPRDLELFTFDRSASVRQQACKALRRLFPTRTFVNCGSVNGSDSKQ